jgi:hypothetical protein
MSWWGSRLASSLVKRREARGPASPSSSPVTATRCDESGPRLSPGEGPAEGESPQICLPTGESPQICLPTGESPQICLPTGESPRICLMARHGARPGLACLRRGRHLEPQWRRAPSTSRCAPIWKGSPRCRNHCLAKQPLLGLNRRLPAAAGAVHNRTHRNRMPAMSPSPNGSLGRSRSPKT